jgi:hypothetical protein
MSASTKTSKHKDKQAPCGFIANMASSSMNPKVKLDADVTEVQEKMLTLLRTKTKNHWGIQLHLIHVTVEVLIKKHKICPGPPYKVNQKDIDEIRKITAENSGCDIANVDLPKEALEDLISLLIRYNTLVETYVSDHVPPHDQDEQRKKIHEEHFHKLLKTAHGDDGDCS